MRVWKRPVLLSYVLVGLIALVLRVADLGQFVTHDEIEFWFGRSESLLRALQSGNLQTMEISTHPGVTTMWLGSAGIVLRRFLFEQGILQHETFPTILALHRLPMALAHVVGVLLGYGMLRRLFSPMVAVLAALLWATDPFIVGYSRLLHVDALMGTCATLSLLAACCFWGPSRQWGWLAGSGICAGLAILSKSPALALVPVVGVLALVSTYRTPSSRSHSLAAFAAWGGVVLLTVVVLWPALWISPARVYEALRVGVEVEGAQPHMTGNFFLGRSDLSPGWRFYPVALVLRTTPWALVGLLLLPFVFRGQGTEVRGRGAEGRSMALLVGFIILFVVAMSFFPKKFNRYLVPIFPSVNIVAAAGLVWGAERATRRVSSGIQGKKGIVGAVSVSLLGAAALVNAAWWHPYGLCAFNPVFGGAQKGAQTFAVGWGEGLEQAAVWLNRQPDITDVLVISHMITSLNPFLRAGARATFPDEGRLRAGAGYVVTYIYQVQGERPPPPFDQFYGQLVPRHTVTIHGVDYAWIYEAPPLVERRLNVGLGEAIQLYGVDQDGPARRGQPLRFHLVWTTRAVPASDYWVFVHLVRDGSDDSDGSGEKRRYAQVDQPYSTSTWEPGRFVTTEVRLPLPADLPPGDYQVVVGLYEQQRGQRLTVTSGGTSRGGGPGSDRLVLMSLRLE